MSGDIGEPPKNSGLRAVKRIRKPDGGSENFLPGLKYDIPRVKQWINKHCSDDTGTILHKSVENPLKIWRVR